MVIVVTDIVRTAPDYQPYVAGTFRWRLALRPLELDDWIQIGHDYDHEMDRKSWVLDNHYDTAVAVLPGIEHEAANVLASIVDHLTTTWPDWFEVRDGRIFNLHRDESFAIAPGPDGEWAEHPLSVAGRLIQEDLALLVERDGRLVFGGGTVCFPNRWDLTSKLGLTMAEVHAPVSQLNEQLERPIDDFFTRLSDDKPFWRLGWGVLDTDDLYQPLDGTASTPPPIPAVGDPSTPDRLYLRVERETLRRYSSPKCVLFTIRTYIRPLSHLAERPEDAARLADALANLPDDVADYKKISDLSAAARHWLTAVAQGRDIGGPITSDDERTT